MKKYLVSILFAAMFSLAGISTSAQSATESEALLAASRPYTAKFIDEMTSHHKHGIMMARLVESRAQHGELRYLARMMVADQEGDIREMQNIRERSFSRLWKPVDHGVGMNLSKLASLRGLSFDLAFIDSMIAHHPAAIYLGQEAARRSGSVQIRQLGNKTANKQIRELEQLRAWRDSWSTR